MRKMDEMFETTHIQCVLNTFQKLLQTNNANNHKIETCIQDTLHFLHDFNNLKHALDSSVIVAITDTDGIIIYANDKFCKISKYTREELIGKNHRLLNSGYHDPSFFRQMWAQIKSGQIWEGEIRNKAKDGSIYWVKTTIVPLKDEHGIPFMYMTLRTDITEGRLAQERLVKALENDFRFVVNSMHNLIFKVVKTADGFKYILNEGKLAYELGLEKEKMFLKSPEEIFPEDISSLLKQRYTQAFTGMDISYQYSFKGKQLLTYLSPIYRDGEVIELIGCINEITELHEAQEKIKLMAFQDNTTDLPNRRKFSDDLVEFIKSMDQAEYQLAVFFLDLDRFKQINDTFGHTTGDLLIKEVALRLKEVVARNGNVYRLAGDEFMIIYPNIEDCAVVSFYASQILSLFETAFTLSNQMEIHTSASIGISIYPNHGHDPDTLLKNADIAMYQAKDDKKNTFKIYQPEMNQQFEEAMLIEHYLKNAIDYHELELYFQPKIDLPSKKMNGIEALLRWNNPKLGQIPPAKFIPIAEETGFIIKLDEWVLEKACYQNKVWNDTLFTQPTKVSVNISPQHFRLPNFENIVKRVLDKTGLNPRLLEIEITEHSFVENIEECIICLKRLSEMGVSIAIDDFGIGYSSLNYLRKFPIQCLKIDRSFIQEVSENRDNIAIVRAIIYLAHELNLKVVAEGIETEEVIHLLEELGCDEIQGYFISKPLPVKAFEDFFQRMNHGCMTLI